MLDSNSASDGDIWMAWSLLEAGRLWKETRYTEVGTALLKRIAREEVVNVPGLGSMLLPGKIGFAEANSWRFNPSYLPPQLAQYFSRFGAPWSTLRETNLRLLLETAPKGFSPDWVRYESKQGWQLKAEKTLISSYDAIRVYLWAGMMHDGDPQKARLLARFKPMATLTMKKRRSTGESGCRQRERARDGAGRVFRRLTAFPAKSRRPGRAATAGRRPFSWQRCLLQLCADSLWTRLGSAPFSLHRQR